MRIDKLKKRAKEEEKLIKKAIEEEEEDEEEEEEEIEEEEDEEEEEEKEEKKEEKKHKAGDIEPLYQVVGFKVYRNEKDYVIINDEGLAVFISDIYKKMGGSESEEEEE